MLLTQIVLQLLRKDEAAASGDAEKVQQLQKLRIITWIVGALVTFSAVFMAHLCNIGSSNSVSLFTLIFAMVFPELYIARYAWYNANGVSNRCEIKKSDALRKSMASDYSQPFGDSVSNELTRIREAIGSTFRGGKSRAKQASDALQAGRDAFQAGRVAGVGDQVSANGMGFGGPATVQSAFWGL